MRCQAGTFYLSVDFFVLLQNNIQQDLVFRRTEDFLKLCPVIKLSLRG
jgi:hypothetical protein